MSTELAKPTINGQLVSPFQALAQYQREHCNILLPVVQIDELPAATRLSVRMIQLDPNPKAGDVYRTEGGKLALHGRTLDQLAAAAGMSWLEITRTDNRNHPYYCEFIAVGEVTDFDGMTRKFVGTKTLDLRSNIPGTEAEGKDVTGMSPKQLGKTRQYITELCAAKAKNRAVRGLLQIKQGYTAQELQKPFIIPKLVVDTAHQAAQSMLLQRLTGGSGQPAGALYSQPKMPEAIEVKTETQPVPESHKLPVSKRMRDMWSQFRKAGGGASDFGMLVSSETGVHDHADLTHADADAVENILSDYV